MKFVITNNVIIILDYVRAVLNVHVVLRTICVWGGGKAYLTVNNKIIIFNCYLFLCHRFRNVRRRRVVFRQETRKPQSAL